MRKWQFIIQPAAVFVLAQLAWLSLLGLWIYWYVSNYIIFEKVGDKLSPQIVAKSVNIVALVSGLILLVAILVAMYLIFIYLNKQLNLTKMYDNFIANVTHELKSPLSSIQLYLETLNMRDVPRARQREFIALMMNDADRLKNLINSILEISGLEQKKIAHSFRVYRAEAIIRVLIDEAIEQFKLPENVIETKGSAPCRCVVDRNALKIVCDNLIDNAIKYTPGAIQMKITLACTHKNFVVEFIDQGVGISAKDQKQIFKKFHRIHNNNIPNVKGTGLGLYWVKEIIKYHGGRVSVFSEGLNRGSTFRLELPIYQASKRRHVNYLLKITKKREKEKVATDE